MAINFHKTGRKIIQLAEVNSEKFQIRYNKNGISELSKKGSVYGDILEDVFTGCSKPVLEVKAKPTSKHSKLNMVTKDGNEVITEVPLLFSKEDSIIDMFPQTVGRLKKIVLNRQDAEEILLKDDDLRMYFARPFYSAKKPVLEISSKSEDKFQIAVISVKDGDRTVARGAYSISKGESGKKVKKYHFYNESSVIAGNNVKGKNKPLDLLPSALKKRVEILSDYLLREKERLLLNHKYALFGKNRKSEEDLGYMLGLTRDRVKTIIQNALSKVKEYNLTPEMARNYERYSKVPKYLNKDEVISYRNFLNDLLSGDAKKRANALSAIQDIIDISRIRSNRKVYNVIHDIPIETEEAISPSPVTEVFIIKE